MRERLRLVILVAALALGLAFAVSAATGSADDETPQGESPFVPVQPKPWNRQTECFLDKHWGPHGIVAEWICQSPMGQQMLDEKPLPKPPKPPSGKPKSAPHTEPTPTPTPIPEPPKLVPFWLGAP